MLFDGKLLNHQIQKEPLPTNFPCLFCNHEKSVSVKLDKKAGIGELSCKICGQQFQTGINCELGVSQTRLHLFSGLIPKLADLSAGVDVYSDWIDACDTVAKEAADTTTADDGFNSYGDLAAGNERRSSDMNIDRHLVSAVGGNEYGGDFIDDDE
jgi:transcription elongation factor Elf1